MGGLRKSPQVSVLLPVYNGVEFLGAAIESILNQSFADFELIIIDDGSTDNSQDVLDQLHNEKIRLYHQQNRGLAVTLNRGIALSRGKFIARQDQDDRSLPDRLANQVTFLNNHEDCALVGTWSEIWRGDKKTERLHRNPIDNTTLKFELLFNNPFVHSSVMLRKEALTLVGGYSSDPLRQPPEDYELWSRIARHYNVANIPEILHVYREVPKSMSRSGDNPFLSQVLAISSENIAWAAGLSPDNPQVRNIAALMNGAWKHVIVPPNYSAMQSIMSRAVCNIAHPDMHQEILSIAKERLMTLTATFWWQYGFSIRGILFRYWRYGHKIAKQIFD